MGKTLIAFQGPRVQESQSPGVYDGSLQRLVSASGIIIDNLDRLVLARRTAMRASDRN